MLMIWSYYYPKCDSQRGAWVVLPPTGMCYNIAVSMKYSPSNRGVVMAVKQKLSNNIVLWQCNLYISALNNWGIVFPDPCSVGA